MNAIYYNHFVIICQGVITVNNPLDAERTHYYILTVTTVDNGPLKLIQPTAATVSGFLLTVDNINSYRLTIPNTLFLYYY